MRSSPWVGVASGGIFGYFDGHVKRGTMLRDFQSVLQNGCFQAWHEGAINVMPVMATGGGKTVVIADTIKKFDAPTCAIAHRQELVGQLALALNRERIPHAIIAPKKVIQQIIAWEVETHGYSVYSPRAIVRVAAVDTLIRRDPNDRWFNQVLLTVVDEGHHVLRANKWGRALLMLPNARGIFPTAHAIRADGQGLGRDAKTADGLVDRLVIGPCGRELIDRGFLCNFRLVCPPSHLNLSGVAVGSTGDFNQQQLRAAVHQDGTIVGDVVNKYIEVAGGKLGITFAVDIESAIDLAKGYRARGVPAEVITGETPIPMRSQLMRKFRNRQILQLVSVDVLGEGVDVPAVEVVSMARPTASFQLYAQQFGRALRLLLADDVSQNWGAYTDEQRLGLIAQSAKPNAIILDHVGNCHRFYEEHKFVDSPQKYSLSRREKSTRQKKGDAIPLRTCLVCTQPYEVVEPVCPYCGSPHVPQGRTKPEEVDGDIYELDPAVMAKMRGDIAKIDRQPFFPKDATPVIINSIKKQHLNRQEGQATLRQAIALWAGWQKHQQRSDSEAYRRFFYKFGTDVLTAQTLSTADAGALEARIRVELDQHNVIEARTHENSIAIPG